MQSTFVCEGGVQRPEEKANEFFSQCPVYSRIISEVLSGVLKLILYIIWIVQSKKIHFITACTVMTPTHGQDRETFD